jgi:hypothetical protein
MAAAGADRRPPLVSIADWPSPYRHGTSPFSDRFKSEVRRSAMVLVKTPPQPDYGTEIREGDRVDQPATNARQGVTEHNVRYVLLASITGVVAMFALIYLFFFVA